MSKIDLMTLSKDTLIDLVNMYSQDILTIDGLYFLEIEKDYGLDKAVEMDTRVWERFAAIEARRIKRILNIQEGGIPGLVQALNFSSWARSFGIEYEFAEVTNNRLVFNITGCGPQRARIKKGLGEFPCKSVGIIYFKVFAAEIDPGLRMNCLLCPPDKHTDDLWCSWEFTKVSEEA